MTFFRFSVSAIILLAFVVSTRAADPFAVGKVWEGKRRAGPDDKHPFSIKLTITERGNDESFKGNLLLINPENKNENNIPVTGKASYQDPGYIKFSAIKGKLSHVYDGVLKNGQVGFKFSGKNPAGLPVSGLGTLNPK